MTCPGCGAILGSVEVEHACAVRLGGQGCGTAAAAEERARWLRARGYVVGVAGPWIYVTKEER